MVDLLLAQNRNHEARWNSWVDGVDEGTGSRVARYSRIGIAGVVLLAAVKTTYIPIL